MKQLLFLVVLVLVGYFVLWGGATRVLYKADINPKNLISNIATTIDEDYIPEIDPNRNGFKSTNVSSYNQIKENVFVTYDPDVCFAFVDLVYSSGSREAEALIRRYLTMFTLPEDKGKILNLLKTYKDKQTLNILLSLYKNSGISKVALLNLMVGYHTPQVAQIINNATLSEDLTLSQAAQSLVDSIGDKKWYQDGLKVNLESGNKAAKKDFDSQMSQY